MKTEDTEGLGRQSYTKQHQSQIQSTDLQELLVSLCTIITVHNTVTQRQIFHYSPSFKPTSHLRCNQVDVRGL